VINNEVFIIFLATSQPRVELVKLLF